MKPFLALQRGIPTALVTLVLIFGCVTALVPLSDASDRLNRMPAFGSGYMTRDVAITEGERTVFGKARVLRREIVCTLGSDLVPVVLTVIDGTNERHAVHDPTYCFRGAGWEAVSGVEERKDAALGSYCITHLGRGNERREVLYFFSDHRQRYTSPTKYWWDATVRRLTLGQSGAEPLLVLLEVDPARTKGHGVKDVLPTLTGMLGAL